MFSTVFDALRSKMFVYQESAQLAVGPRYTNFILFFCLGYYNKLLMNDLVKNKIYTMIILLLKLLA